MNFKKKKKILFSGEASFSPTGYGAYYSQLINRVFNSGKYRVAEFASFSAMGDPRDNDIRWRYYVNEANPQNQQELDIFRSNEANKTGAWRFDKVLLDFQPDIVVELRDSTMFQYQMLSPLRKFFFHAISPSIDSAPQIDEWVDLMMQADAFLGYSNFAMDVAKQESQGKIKTFKSAYPGVDQKSFYPIKNKIQLRQKYGLQQDANIICMCGRNQIRKLIPELIKGFRLYLDKAKQVDINMYNNSFLYIHTTQPDLKTWNLSKILVEYQVANKVLFTYNCTACNKYFPNRFHDSITSCRFCGKEALMPRVDRPVVKENLNEIYNLADLYVQCASAGATEFPLVEAAGAGCNVMATDWAGTGDAVRRLEGIPLKVAATPRDINVDADRASPDNEFFADELIKFFRRPRQINLRNGIKTSERAYKKFSWDKNAEIWMSLFDSCELKGYQGKWGTNINWQPQGNLPENLPIQQWVYNFLELALQEEHLKHSFFIDDSIKHAEMKIRSTGNGLIGWTRNEVKNMLQNLFNNKGFVEEVRTGRKGFPIEDWILYAEQKELSNIQ